MTRLCLDEVAPLKGHGHYYLTDVFRVSGEGVVDDLTPTATSLPEEGATPTLIPEETGTPTPTPEP